MSEWWALTVEVEGTPIVVRARTSERIMIGRARTCPILIPAATVARQHGSLDVDVDGRVFLQDLGSSNGVWLNGEKIQRAELPVGSELMLGRGVVRFMGVAPADAPQRWTLGVELTRNGEEVRERFELGPNDGIKVGGFRADVALHPDRYAVLRVDEGVITVVRPEGRHIHDPNTPLDLDGTEVWLTVTPVVRTQALATAPRTEGSSAAWRIHIGGAGRPREFDVATDERVFIGSAHECSLVLRDARVEPCHATVSVDHKGRLIVEEVARDPAIRRTHREGAALIVGPFDLEVGFARLR
ncbi:MAG: FHA domain-containing protein [Deltaproteobacteria bacterium]